mmetsp:Transcript_9079/g.14720  ORF Transcript_9079/g.14720 Transcript_9079/m.14720 type:complete len:149 (-) Transcript_9079:8-454(-)
MVAQKRRFLLFEVLPSSRVDDGELLRAIREAFEADWGQVAEAQASLRLLYFSPSVHLGILRIHTRLSDRLRSTLTLLSSVAGVSLQLQVHCVSGSFSALQRVGERLLRKWQRSAEQRTSRENEREAVKQGFQTELRLLAEANPQPVGW